MNSPCKNCPEMDVNYNSGEAYCNLADGEEIVLRRGQHRPKWCPKRKTDEEQKKGGCNGCAYKGSEDCPLHLVGDGNFFCPNGRLA